MMWGDLTVDGQKCDYMGDNKLVKIKDLEMKVLVQEELQLRRQKKEDEANAEKARLE
jgi:hypothetical protein